MALQFLLLILLHDINTIMLTGHQMQFVNAKISTSFDAGEEKQFTKSKLSSSTYYTVYNNQA